MRQKWGAPNLQIQPPTDPTPHLKPSDKILPSIQGKSKYLPDSTSTVAALFSKMALTGQRIAMVDMVFLVFTALPYLP